MLVWLAIDTDNGMLADHTSIFVQKKTIKYGERYEIFVIVYVCDGVNNREIGLDELNDTRCEPFSDRKLISLQQFDNNKQANIYIDSIHTSINQQVRDGAQSSRKSDDDEDDDVVEELIDINRENKDILIALRTLATEHYDLLSNLVDLLKPKPKPKAPRKKKDDKNANMD